jgi:TetR/AcrR family transcriptional regulator
MAQALRKRTNKDPSPSVVNRGGRVAVRLVDQPAEIRPLSGQDFTAKVRGADVRKRILRTALEYFGTFGFEGTSTRAVAEKAHVTHTLVLYHFKSKDRLWIATVEESLKKYGETVLEMMAAAPQRTARDSLSIFVENFVRMSARQPHIHRLMTMEGNQNTKRIEWIINRFLRGHFTFVRDLIRRGQAEGSVRQCDPARLYYLIIGAGGTPFTLKTEYKTLTGRDVFSEAEVLRNIAFIYEIVFI